MAVAAEAITPLTLLQGHTAAGAAFGAGIGAFMAAGLVAIGRPVGRKGFADENFRLVYGSYVLGSLIWGGIGAYVTTAEPDKRSRAALGAVLGGVISHSVNFILLYNDPEWIPGPGALGAGVGAWAATR